jgi:secondary thiamine-phosphate synthase enzyme
LKIRTGDRPKVHDLTSACAKFVAGAAATAARAGGDADDRIGGDTDDRTGGGDGLLHVFVPHATAGLAVLETGAGSDDDLLAALDDLLPADARWRHRHGSAGHGRDHVMPALVPPYASIPVLDGRLALGTWQSICLVDLNRDNAVRSVRLSFLPA